MNNIKRGEAMTMNFEGYGEIEWLEPEQYYTEPWKYLEMATGEDRERYDIVVNGDYPCEIRYTII